MQRHTGKNDDERTSGQDDRTRSASSDGVSDHRRVLALQRSVGNTATAALIGRMRGRTDAPLAQRPPAEPKLAESVPLQRDVGWPKATGWNKTARTIDSKHSMVRIPLAGLAKQNQDPSPNKEKTDEEAAGEAIVWLRPDLDVSKEVLVLVHLHGLTDRSADPFAGYRENNADPKTEESAEARKVAKEKKGFVNPLAHKVRDVERDRIGQQVEAVEDESKVADRQLIAVLPQGTGKSQKKGEPPQKPGFGKNFDATPR